jgi:Sigma-70 region 2
MTAAQTSDLMRFLRGIMRSPQAADLSDGQLLGRFVEHRDEAAFAGLVRSLGPLVWGVCRRLLTNRQDAEDAFQATFCQRGFSTATTAHNGCSATSTAQTPLSVSRQQLLAPNTGGPVSGSGPGCGSPPLCPCAALGLLCRWSVGTTGPHRQAF